MANGIRRILSLMPCALRMLTEGVKENQRTACFRLAAQLRKVGLPYEYTVMEYVGSQAFRQRIKELKQMRDG